MKLTRRWKIVAALFAAAIILAGIFIWNISGTLVAPSNHPIGKPPGGLHVENVAFPSASGATIHGWFVAGSLYRHLADGTFCEEKTRMG